MKPSPFLLHIPQTLPKALDLLANLENCRVIAGGQSLMPMLNMRLAAPDNLVDLNRIGELGYIRDEGDEITIGAMTRQRDIEYSDLIAQRLPLMKEAILQVGHRQTRNRGTLGGSLCHLDPSAEMPTVMMAMGAKLVVQSVRGSRILAMSEFAEGMMTTALLPDEVLAQIRLRPWAPAHGSCFVEFARRHGDFAVASAAAMFELDRNRRIVRVSLTLGGVAATPWRVVDAEAALVGQSDDTGFTQAADAAQRCDALDDPAFPSWYRQRLAGKLLRRAMDCAYRRAQANQGKT
ncbi:MAG: xanthine dehydrogenase family protein subunit M [Betaproteobacteria bacterium]